MYQSITSQCIVDLTGSRSSAFQVDFELIIVGSIRELSEHDPVDSSRITMIRLRIRNADVPVDFDFTYLTVYSTGKWSSISQVDSSIT